MAPAGPATPPPLTLTLMSKRRSISATRSGCMTSISRTRRPRYWSGVLSLMMIRPFPGVSRTRAIAVFRGPTARLACWAANLPVPFRVEGDGFRRLGLVLVLGPGVDAQALEHLRAQRVVLEHAAHGVLHREGGVDLLLLAKGAPLQTARVAGVTGVHRALRLVARDDDE